MKVLLLLRDLDVVDGLIDDHLLEQLLELSNRSISFGIWIGWPSFVLALFILRKEALFDIFFELILFFLLPGTGVLDCDVLVELQVLLNLLLLELAEGIRRISQLLQDGVNIKFCKESVFTLLQDSLSFEAWQLFDRCQAGAGIQESGDQIVHKYLRLAELKSFEHVLNRFSTVCVFLALFLQVVGLSNVDLEQDS